LGDGREPTSRHVLDLADHPRENGPAMVDERHHRSERNGVGQGEGSITLRQVMLEMIHEYARHLGQKDPLREWIDRRSVMQRTSNAFTHFS
jgi:preprotein translocase subunit SecA